MTLDDQLGAEFADKVRAWLEARGEKGRGMGVVMKNPDKSKHLETATMQLRGFSVDFVNLRTEEYTKDSRIPVMDIGSPKEDALRRDLTINSLFYNIRTRQVEDYTGAGLLHLRQRLVATPLAAKITLLDDPLRLLRAVRFATRLGFNMSPDLVEAAMDQEVREALAEKVSRERIGTEFDLMLTAKPSPAVQSIWEKMNRNDGGRPAGELRGPVRAVTMLHELGVSEIVVAEPGRDEVKPGSCLGYNPGNASRAQRHASAVLSIGCAEALLTAPRHELLRYTLGVTGSYGQGWGEPAKDATLVTKRPERGGRSGALAVNATSTATATATATA
eukprot:CAMPEP_0119517558 /NCGR_PEP_ID=MMETSP1344-20130328/34414_1 /TAXON_ID=236787 /ORGANISM="Florenciella parvula, Strain CCMP2471" /LENGTH=331 /DNA_ID=CAMNT_0007555159 /DNA_START=26 /DNA_END=1018 /DNA_ORIENTATION=-